MGENKVVYVVVEDWTIDSGERDIYTSVYSTFERAVKELIRLKQNYEIDYETEERRKNGEVFTEVENIDIGNKIAEILVRFKDSADFYRIWIDERVVDYNLDL